MLTATRPASDELVELVQSRTNRAIRNLSVELRPGRVVLRGQARSFYLKQLAQHELIGTLPENMRVENSINVIR